MSVKWTSVMHRASSAAGASKRTTMIEEPLLLEWLTLGGLLVFAGWLLGMRGVWQLLLRSDPTGLTLVIIVLFVVATLWCGQRSRELQQQRRWLDAARRDLQAGRAPAASVDESWVAEYWHGLASHPRDAGAPLDLLLEHAQGAHHTAWWVNGIQLKLGLLGKVIGFSMLAMQIGNMQNFDAAQSQELLKSLTSGLGVALLTTMVGLVGNVVLGMQLVRLDRYADALVSDCQRVGMQAVGVPATSTMGAKSWQADAPTAGEG